MANISGPQHDVRYCPECKGDLENVPRSKMKTRVTNRDGDVPPHTHTYKCTQCSNTFEINQHR